MAKQGLIEQKLNNVWNWIILGILVGFVAGAGVGYLLNSSSMISFSAVMTRGESLNGLDALLRPAAEHIFNATLAYGLVGAIVEAVGGFVVGKTKIAFPQ